MYCSIANKCNNYVYNIEEGYCKRLYEINHIITQGSILLFFYWPEAIHVTFHFLTY
jgi:hypothetical protein